MLVPLTSNESSRSPAERHGMVAASPFVQTLDLWFSSKVRKELPVVSLRWKPKCPKVVDAADSGLANDERRFDLPGVQPPGWLTKCHPLGFCSLTPPPKPWSLSSGASMTRPAP